MEPNRLDGRGGTLWIMPLREATIDELLDRAQLSEAEHIRFGELKNDQRRKEWLATRVLAREQLGCRIGYHPSDAPYPEGLPGKYISVTHTQGYAALQCHTAPCGADIEHFSRCALGAARRFAAPDEVTLVERHFTLNTEMLIWCAKEAAYKAAGSPETDLLHDIRITAADGRSIKLLVKNTPVEVEYSTNEELIIAFGTISG